MRNVSLTIEKGEIFGIVGSSGAGKSTLLRTINLLERPTQGQVLLEGRDITGLANAELRDQRHKIGMIFQHFNLMHTYTVWENITFALRAAKAPSSVIRQRVPEILELVGLSDKADAYTSQLSGGQKQRVGIARALANQPELLLCDEPTSALDLETSASILELLKAIHRKLGITIVIISHEMAVIKTICDRVAVMDKGEIVELGSVYEVFARPRHQFTKQLVERTFNFELPARALDITRGKILKILFLEENAEKPLLNEMALWYGVSVNILHGKIEYVAERPIGLLVVVIDGEDGALVDAINFLRSRAGNVEVLR